MNTPVSFELAKLLKEKGFDNDSLCYYSELNKCFIPVYSYKVTDSVVKNHSDGREQYYKAPTISDVVMWLHEKHGFWVMVKHLSQNNWMYDIQNGIFSTHADDKFNLPTQAYESAIEYTLKNLIP